MRILLIFLFFVVGQIALAQPGFNQRYLFPPYPAGGFRNGLYLNGQLYLYTGLNHDSIGGLTGIGMVIADTNGVVQQLVPYFETQLDGIGVGRNFPLFQASDGLLTVGGTYWDGESGFIGRFNPATSEFESPIAITQSGYHFQSTIIELSDGWLTVGSAHAVTGRLIVYATKVDQQGNKIWTRYYGDDTGLYYLLGAVFLLNHNTIVLGGGIFLNSGSETLWGVPWAFAIDSVGNKKWEWTSQIGNQQVFGGILALYRMENNDWLYTTTDADYTSGEYPTNSIKVVRRDSSWNLLWEKVLNASTYYLNHPIDMKPSPDGNYIVATQTAIWPVPGGAAYLAGCLHKVTPDGDEVWRACDTPWVNATWENREIFVSGLVVMPSGSSVLVGGATRAWPNPQSYGWMFKVDANGCMYAPCSVGVEAPDAPAMALKAWPNPAVEGFSVRLPLLQEGARAEVYDVQGRLMAQKDIWPAQETVYFGTDDWPLGLYALRLVQQGRVLGVGRVVKGER